MYICLILGFKMVKITTRKQFEILIREMENNPQIARGVRSFGETKANTEAIWKRITEKLNRVGPPLRTPEEWQRVWVHFKAKLKKKMFHNKTNLTTTGGGPSEEVSLSPIQQAAVELLQLEMAANPQENLNSNLAEGLEQQETELQNVCEWQQEPEELEQQNEQEDVKDFQQTINNLEDIKYSIPQEQTETQSEGVATLKNIEKTMYKSYEILKEMTDLKRKNYDVLKEIKEIKKRKLDLLIEEHNLNRKIKQKKLEVLEKQILAAEVLLMTGDSV